MGGSKSKYASPEDAKAAKIERLRRKSERMLQEKEDKDRKALEKRLSKEKKIQDKKNKEEEKKEKDDLEKLQRRKSKLHRNPQARESTSRFSILSEVTSFSFGDQEEREINEMYLKFDKSFSELELQRLYLAFKENGKTLTKEDFEIVYMTYTRQADTALASRVFDLFDKHQTGSFTFEALITFLYVVLKGNPQQKMEYCFKLYDPEELGEISRQSLVDILCHLPLHRLLNKPQPVPSITPQNSSQSILGSIAEDEETEEAERVVEQQQLDALDKMMRQEENEMIRAQLLGASGAPSSSSSKPKKEEGISREDYELAVQVAEQIFSDIPHDKRDRITLKDFVSSVGSTDGLKVLFPF